MNILDQIIEHKRKEVADRKSLYPVKLLEQSIYFSTQPVSRGPRLEHHRAPNGWQPGGQVSAKSRSFGMFVAFPLAKRGVHDDIQDPPT